MGKGVRFVEKRTQDRPAELKWRERLAQRWHDTSSEARVLVFAIAGSVLLHLVGAVVLHVVEPAEFYSHTLALYRSGGPRAAAGDRARTQPASPEPKIPLHWAHEYRPVPELWVRATMPLSPEEVGRLGQMMERAEIIYLAEQGLDPQRRQVLQARFVTLEVMNDPAYFDREPQGIYYGRYFPESNIVYLSPLAFIEERHIAHELCHYLADEYDVRMPSLQAEARARRFERTYVQYERSLSFRHVVNGTTDSARLRADWFHDGALAETLYLRSRFAVLPKQMTWLRRMHALGTIVFPMVAERPFRPDPSLTVAVVANPARGRVVGDARAVGAERGAYDSSHDTIYVPHRVFWDGELLGHQLAHHFVDLYGLTLEPEREESLAFRFERTLQRAMRGDLESPGAETIH